MDLFSGPFEMSETEVLVSAQAIMNHLEDKIENCEEKITEDLELYNAGRKNAYKDILNELKNEVNKRNNLKAGE